MPYWRLHYHLVWSTANREPLISDEFEETIRWSLERTFSRLNIIPHAVGVMPDHIHLAVSIPPKESLSQVVRQLKGASSHAINQRHDATFHWQSEYGAFTFSDHGLPDVIAYVANQRQHHQSNKLLPRLERTDPDD